MVDTIVLEIDLGNPKTQKVINPAYADTWAPSLKGALLPPFNMLGSGKSIKCVKNVTPEEKRAGAYVPRLTFYKQMIKGKFKYYLYIEFSAPKVLFNNNFEEVEKSDLDVLCQKLSETLKAKGVNLTPNELRKSVVKTIHYSKNIIITDGTPPNRILTAIKKANLSTRKRVRSEIYQDRGEGLHIFNTTRSLCVYDKIKELEKARNTEKGNFELDSWCQFGIVGEILKSVGAIKSLDVVRFETRLSDKETIKKAVSPIISSMGYGAKSPYTLEMLFDEKLAKSVLINDFNEIREGLPAIVSNRETAEFFVRKLAEQNPSITPSAILQALGLRCLTGEVNLRDARVIIGANTKIWNRLNSKMTKLKYRQAIIADPLLQVKQQLDTFASFRLGKGVKGV